MERILRRQIPCVMVLLAAAAVPAQDASPRIELFDGRTLDGWERVAGSWSVEEGSLVGAAEGGGRDGALLVGRGDPVADFELEFEVRVEAAGEALVGYRCDLLPTAAGFCRLYGRGSRGVIARPGEAVVTHPENVRPRVVATLPVAPGRERTAWRRVRIVARGSVLLHEVDGVTTARLDDRWARAYRTGTIARECSGPPPARVAFRRLRLTRLPPVEPGEDATPGLLATRIWSANNEGDVEIWARRRFELRAPVANAPLTVSCDNRCEVFVNGERVLDARDWERPSTVDVGRHLRIGDNVIAVHAANEGGPAALALWLRWHDPAGGGGELVSGTDWRIRTEPVERWTALDYDDAPWVAASMVHGTAGLGHTVWDTEPKPGGR